MNRNKGFTLIELMVVISIIALLSSIVFASLNSAKKKAQATVIRANFDQLQKAMILFQDSNDLKVINQAVFSGNSYVEPFHGIEAGSTSDTNNFYIALDLLVQGHYISYIARNPIYDNNNGSDFRYIYWTEKPSSWTKQYADGYYACGTKPFGTYALMVYDPNNKFGAMLNMDGLIFYGYDWLSKSLTGYVNPFPGYYCLTNDL